MAKSKTKTEKNITPSVRHSIPMAGERRGTSKIADRFRRKAKPTTRSPKDTERAVIDIDASIQKKFVDYARTKEVFDLVEAKKDQQQKSVSGEIYERFVDTLWASKSQPQNPSIRARSNGTDAEGLFIVSAGSKIRINVPEPGEGEDLEAALVRSLVTAGVDQPNAERIVENEVSFMPEWKVNLTELMRGEVKAGKIVPPTPTQTTAAEILLCVINGEDLDGNPLTHESRGELLESITDDGWFAIRANMEGGTKYVPILADSESFLDRVCGYADSREELRSILAVFQPTYFCTRVKFATSDSPADKKKKMLEEAKAVLGCN